MHDAVGTDSASYGLRSKQADHGIAVSNNGRVLLNFSAQARNVQFLFEAVLEGVPFEWKQLHQFACAGKQQAQEFQGGEQPF